MSTVEIIGFVAMLLIAGGTSYLLGRINKNVTKLNDTRIIKPRLEVVYLIPTVLLMGLVVMFTFKDRLSDFIWFLVAIMVVAVIGFIFFIINYKNWKIEVFEDHLVYINTFGKKVKLDYKDIKVEDNSYEYRISKGEKKLFMISKSLHNYELFKNSYEIDNEIIMNLYQGKTKKKK